MARVAPASRPRVGRLALVQGRVDQMGSATRLLGKVRVALSKVRVAHSNVRVAI